jgi:hypothetical protein
MRDAIIEKLTRHLSKPPECEADVVYAFVQVRKLLERDRAKKAYPRLTFFCDWVVHGHLSGTEAAEVLRQLDDGLNRYDPTRPFDIDRHGKVLPILSHRQLQAEMGRYLAEVGVEEIWTVSLRVWHDVARLYSEVIRDCPLVMPQLNTGLTYLRQVEITECEPVAAIVAANPHAQHHGWNWKFTLSDGRCFSLQHTSSIGPPP